MTFILGTADAHFQGLRLAITYIHLRTYTKKGKKAGHGSSDSCKIWCPEATEKWFWCSWWKKVKVLWKYKQMGHIPWFICYFPIFSPYYYRTLLALENKAYKKLLKSMQASPCNFCYLQHLSCKKRGSNNNIHRMTPIFSSICLCSYIYKSKTAYNSDNLNSGPWGQQKVSLSCPSC